MPWVKLLEALVVISGVILTVYQLHDIALDEASHQNDLADKYYSILNTGTDKAIFSAIENDKPILASNKGKFTTDQLDDYLDDLDSVGQAMRNKLINTDLACDDFYDFSNQTNNDAEVNQYIADNRKEDDTYFQDVDYLYGMIKNCQ